MSRFGEDNSLTFDKFNRLKVKVDIISRLI